MDTEPEKQPETEEGWGLGEVFSVVGLLSIFGAVGYLVFTILHWLIYGEFSGTTLAFVLDYLFDYSYTHVRWVGLDKIFVNILDMGIGWSLFLGGCIITIVGGWIDD